MSCLLNNLEHCPGDRHLHPDLGNPGCDVISECVVIEVHFASAGHLTAYT